MTTEDAPADLPLVIRAAVDDERNWILSSWKKDSVDAAWARGLRSAHFWALANYVVDRLVPRSEVLVAALVDDPLVAVAWLAARDGRILYSYVKPRFAGLGIVDRLTAAFPASLERTAFDPFAELEKLA